MTTIIAAPPVRCPGDYLAWSAFGADYPDTVCASRVTFDDGHDPGPVLCDADDDLSPRGGVPCPACDPDGFALWAEDPAAGPQILAREAELAPPP